MKHTALILLCAAMALTTAHAQTKGKQEYKPHFSGYVIGQYQASFQEGQEANSFNLRMARLAVDGYLPYNFYYKLQGQVNGNTDTKGQSPRLVDAFVEWQQLKYLKVKVGQFKRPFSLENPIHPITQGFMGYAQVVSKLSGFTDRVGEHASNGRDIGLQIQGTLLSNPKGRELVHYCIGVFNGQGINTKDVDQRKDIIGGVQLKPLADLTLAAYGWSGSYARKGSDGTVSLNKYRYAVGAQYTPSGWTFRSEYIHSHGAAFKTTYNEKADLKDTQVNDALGRSADGAYVIAIAPLFERKAHVKVRYDLYRQSAKWSSAKTYYEIGADYNFTPGVQLTVEYALVNDRVAADKNYSLVDAQVSVRF